MDTIFIVRNESTDGHHDHSSKLVFSSKQKAKDYADEVMIDDHLHQWVMVEEVELDTQEVISSEEIKISSRVVRAREIRKAYQIMNELGLKPVRRRRRRG